MWQSITKAVETARLAGIYPHVIRFVGLYDRSNDAFGLAQVLAVIQWSMPEHSSEPTHDPKHPGVSQQYGARPANTVLQIAEGRSMSDLESDILSMAWHLGDPMPTRLEKAPWADPKKWQEPGTGIANDWGSEVYKINVKWGPFENDVQVGGGAGSDTAHPANMEHAAAHGYIVMTVYPLAWTKPSIRANTLRRRPDAGLADDFTRTPRPIKAAKLHRPLTPGTGHEQQYDMRKRPNK